MCINKYWNVSVYISLVLRPELSYHAYEVKLWDYGWHIQNVWHLEVFTANYRIVHFFNNHSLQNAWTPFLNSMLSGLVKKLKNSFLLRIDEICTSYIKIILKVDEFNIYVWIIIAKAPVNFSLKDYHLLMSGVHWH